MSFWNSKNIKKTRKVHICEYCGRKIEIGESCNNESGMYEGEFNNYYLCRCLNFISKYSPDLSDGFSSGEFYEEIYNMQIAPCPKCGSDNHREYEWSEDSMKCQFECDDCDEKWEADFSFSSEI